MATSAPLRPDRIPNGPSRVRRGRGQLAVVLTIVAVVGLMASAVVITSARGGGTAGPAPILTPLQVSIPPVALTEIPVPGPSPTVGGPVTDLRLPGFGDVVVDGVHRHVFVSGGSESNDVVVLD